MTTTHRRHPPLVFGSGAERGVALPGWHRVDRTDPTRAAERPCRAHTGAGKRSPLVLLMIVATVLTVVAAGFVVFRQLSKSTHCIAKYPVSVPVDPGIQAVYVTHLRRNGFGDRWPTRKLTATVPIGENPRGGGGS